VVRRKGDEWGWAGPDHRSRELADSCRRLISAREKSGKENECHRCFSQRITNATLESFVFSLLGPMVDMSAAVVSPPCLAVKFCELTRIYSLFCRSFYGRINLN